MSSTDKRKPTKSGTLSDLKRSTRSLIQEVKKHFATYEKATKTVPAELLDRVVRETLNQVGTNKKNIASEDLSRLVNDLLAIEQNQFDRSRVAYLGPKYSNEKVESDLKNEQVKEISERLGVKTDEVVSMNRRMMGQEKSLNEPIKSGEKSEWQDWIADDNMDQELMISQKQELEEKKSLLNDSMKILNEREKEILIERKLSESPKTLEKLSKKYKISRERIRQIETKAFEKLQKVMLNSSKSKNLLPAE